MTSKTPTEDTLRLLRRIAEHREPFLVSTHEARLNVEKLLHPQEFFFGASFVKDFDDYLTAARQVIDDLERQGRSLEHWINVTDATTTTYLYAAHLLGARWPGLEAYSNCRMKPIAREIANDVAGGQRVQHEVVRVTDPAVESLWRQRSRGFVAKPVCGSGSRGVRFISSDLEWTRYVDEARTKASARPWGTVPIAGYLPDQEVLIEERLVADVPGVELEFDGYVDKGTLKLCAIGYKFHECDEHGFRELGGVLSDVGSAALLDRLASPWLTAFLELLSFRNGVFHIEAVLVDGRLALVEINPRQGGGDVVPMVRTLSGVDLLEATVPLWLGRGTVARLPSQPVHHILYAILHPYTTGRVVAWQESASLDCPVLSRREAIWTPSKTLAMEPNVTRGNGEKYLGEMTVVGEPIAVEELPRVMRQLQEWMVAQRLVTIE